MTKEKPIVSVADNARVVKLELPYAEIMRLLAALDADENAIRTAAARDGWRPSECAMALGELTGIRCKLRAAVSK